MKILAVVMTLNALVGCTLWRSEAPQATLADLEPVELPELSAPLPRLALTQLEEVYRQVLLVTEDPELRLWVMTRLADIEMMVGEENLATTDTAPAFEDAISAYRELIRIQPNRTDNDRLLYQLSRAYELNGQAQESQRVLDQLVTAHPESTHALEAQFRQAESRFAAADYAAAQQGYANVVAGGVQTPYYESALYMQGWALFKTGRYQSAIRPFTGVLDLLLSNQDPPLPSQDPLPQLERNKRELAQDSLDIMAVIFSYLEGPQSIAAAYTELGTRPYEALLYQNLGELYLKQERYRDSATSFRLYTQNHPHSADAHQFQLKVITAYQQGDFPTYVLKEKQKYVSSYLPGGDYWNRSSPSSQELIAASQRMFLEQLANHHHARAQRLADRGGANGKSASAQYLAAANYYRTYITHFSEDERAPEMGFLQGECLTQAGQYSDAIAAFEWVAYENNSFSRSADAAYAALLSYQSLHTAAIRFEGADLRRKEIDGQLRFAATFSTDERASAVLSRAASSLLELGSHEQAIAAATTLTQWLPEPAIELQIPAWLAIAHSHFALEHYAAAETAYSQALALLPASDARRTSSRERLAASIYKQGEATQLGGKHSQAALHFARVLELAPESTIRIQAQFDAATAYMESSDYASANALLVDFRTRFPRHELASQIAAKLIHNYEQMGKWQQAAIELDTLASSTAEHAPKGEYLYLAAQYYERDAAFASAITRYKKYAHNWPSPRSQQLEAMHKLERLYEKIGSQEKRRYWLRRLIRACDESSRPSGRSLYLAAGAASVLADDADTAFQQIRLSTPLQRSMKTKTRAMRTALSAWQKTNDYGIQEFTTLASYRIGEIYRALGLALLHSERPPGNNAQARSEYDVLLEEQAFPFEEKAIAIHELNARRSWDGIYDQWVAHSFEALAELLPARYAKREVGLAQPGHPQPPGEQTLTAAIRKSPRDPAPYNRYGGYLRTQGRFQEAEQMYLKALSLETGYADGHLNIGVLYDLYLGDREQALQHYHRYQDLSGASDDAVARWIADLERQLMMLVQGN